MIQAFILAARLRGENLQVEEGKFNLVSEFSTYLHLIGLLVSAADCLLWLLLRLQDIPYSPPSVGLVNSNLRLEREKTSEVKTERNIHVRLQMSAALFTEATPICAEASRTMVLCQVLESPQQEVQSCLTAAVGVRDPPLCCLTVRPAGWCSFDLFFLQTVQILVGLFNIGLGPGRTSTRPGDFSSLGAAYWLGAVVNKCSL